MVVTGLIMSLGIIRVFAEYDEIIRIVLKISTYDSSFFLTNVQKMPWLTLMPILHKLLQSLHKDFLKTII